MDLSILPLAITMMAGPQIISDVIFVTTKKPVKTSLAFVAAVAIAASVGVTILTLLVSKFPSIAAVTNGSPSAISQKIELILVGLLILLAIRTFLRRKTSKPPKWLSSLELASPKKAFKIGLLLIFLMPSDIIIMITVGVHLAAHGHTPLAAWPFLAMTTLIAALPLLGFLLFHRRAVKIMPKVRDWMTSNSWLINIAVYLFFVYLILA